MSYYYDVAFKASTFVCDNCISAVSYDGDWITSRKEAEENGWLHKLIHKKFLYFCSIECWEEYQKKEESC